MRSGPFHALALRLLAALVLALTASAQGGELACVRLAPDEIRLQADPSRPGGMEMAVLAGDLGKAGLYAARIRIPAHLRIHPHTHPEDRVVVVLSGTLLVGYGERFDTSRMKALPPGSFFTEPAGQAHFAWAQTSDVVVQVSGIGPSGTAYVDAASLDMKSDAPSGPKP